MCNFSAMYFFIKRAIRVCCLIVCICSSSIIVAQQPFIPSDISGLQLWLRSDTGLILSGDSVTQWNDISGNGNNAFQTIGLKKPTWISSDTLLNNYPDLKFDGVNSQLQTNYTQPNAYTVFVIYAHRNGDVGSFYSTDVSGYPLQRNTKVFPNSNVAVYPLSDSVNLRNLYVDIQDFQNGNYKTFLNGIYKGGLTQSLSIAGGQMYVGYAGGGEILDGSIAEFILFDTALPDSSRIKVENYLMDRYAPPVNLGPDIVNNNVCTDTIAAGKRFVSFNWSTNATAQSIQVKQSGTYWVTVTDIFGRISSDTINVTYPGNFNPTSLNKTICLGDTLIWDTQLNKTEYSFLWQDNSTDSLFKITLAGKYYVKVTDALSCTHYSDTLTVAVDSFALKTSLGPNSTICSGASIALTQGAAQATSYAWSTGETSSAIVITNSGTYYLTVQDSNGCSAIDSINVHVKGSNPVPGFISPSSCFGDSLHFTDTSFVTLPAHITQWNWGFGDGNSSSLQNPAHSYSVAGTYTTTLTVVSDSGCSATVQKTDTVNPKPTAGFISAFPKCTGSTIQFTDQSSISNGILSSWNWNFGDPASGGNNISVLQNPTHAFNSTGTYSVTQIVTSDKGCSDTVFSSTNIALTPTPSFTADTVCLNANTHFSGTSTGTINNWIWNFDDGNNYTIDNHPQYAFSTPGIHSVTITVTSDSGCTNAYTNQVLVYNLPVSKFVSDSVCVNAPLQFTDLSSAPGSSIISWNWNFGTAGLSIQQNPIVTFTPSGTYSVTLFVTSAEGCKDSSEQDVEVMPLPIPSFSFSPQYGPLPLNVTFSNQSSGASDYIWSFGDGNLSDSINPLHTYQTTGTYYIQLLSESKFGCRDSTTEKLQIDSPALDIADSTVSVNLQPNTAQAYALLKNTGNIDVHSIQLSAYMDDGNPVTETWIGTLAPESSLAYKFNSSFEILSNKNHNIVCVDVMLVNGRMDDNLSNNHSCTAITSDFTLLNPFPNPTSSDIYFLYIIPQDGTVTAEIYDEIGKKAESFQENASAGLNQITFNTINLRNGTYFLKLYYQDASLGKTFIKE